MVMVCLPRITVTRAELSTPMRSSSVTSSAMLIRRFSDVGDDVADVPRDRIDPPQSSLFGTPVGQNVDDDNAVDT